MKQLLRISALYLVTASAAFAQAKVDFAKDIQPILQKTCIQCHGAEKSKGDLRLDSKEAAMKGGKNGPVIIAGDAAKSEVHRRIILPKGHDDVMPTKGEPLSKAQTDLIKDWITQGANWPDGLVLKGTPGSGDESIAVAEPAKLPEIKPTPAELKAVAQLEAAGVSIRPVAQNMNWKEASFRGLGTNATDATIAPIKDVLSLLDLNLAGTKITDTGLVALKNLTNLTMLHLEHTKITDAGLANLKGMGNLRYLNLFDSQITDAGLQQLKSLPQLKNLYVWQSKVTDAGIKDLQAASPKLKIYNGFDTNVVVVKKEEKKEEKPAEKK